MARLSSFTTHPGPLAAEACSFVASLVSACLRRRHDDSSEKKQTARSFLDKFVDGYKIRLTSEIDREYVQKSTDLPPKRGKEGRNDKDPTPPGSQNPNGREPDRDKEGTRGKPGTNRQNETAKESLYRLLCSEESESSLELCWNWRRDDATGGDDDDDGDGCHPLEVEATLRNRGRTYNSYPVSAEYFGSFSLDALAIALYCFRSTTSFDLAIVRAINFLGDADSTASITAQIAGAFYGSSRTTPPLLLPELWTRDLNRWDRGGFELRAICLVVRGWAKHCVVGGQQRRRRRRRWWRRQQQQHQEERK